MNPNEIKAKIKGLGLTQKQIADEIGTRPDMISQLVNGYNYFPRLAQAIKEKYGINIPAPTSRRLQGVVPRKVAA